MVPEAATRRRRPNRNPRRLRLSRDSEPPEPEPTPAAPEAVERPVSGHGRSDHGGRPTRPIGGSRRAWADRSATGAPSTRSASLSFAVERPVRHRRLGLRFSVTGLYPNWPAWSVTMGGAKIAGNAAVVQIPVGMDAYLAFPVRA